MATARVIGSALLAFVFAVCAIHNALVALRYFRRRQSGSVIPIVGGVAGVVASLLHRELVPTPVAFVPLLLDIGCIPTLIGLLLRAIKGET
jgi:hypothetical protein